MECHVCGQEVKNERGLIAHMGKRHPGEYKKYKNQDTLKLKENEMAVDNDLSSMIKEAEQKTNDKRGLLAPPPTEEEKRRDNLANLHFRMLKQWELSRLLVSENIPQKIINGLTENVTIDDDIRQALTIEMYSLIMQPTLQSFGLMGAANEAIYKEYEKMGIKIERPIMATADAVLKEIRTRVTAVTGEKKRKLKGEES